MDRFNDNITKKEPIVKRVRILQTGCFLNNKKYTFMPQLFEYFLPLCFQYKIVDIDEPADICIFSVCLNDKTLLRKNEINIFISIENLPHWNWHLHYTKYGEYGNDMVDIYFYNHKYKVEQTSKYLMVPTVISRMDYYKKVENTISFKETPFKEKKFAFIINTSLLNKPMMEKCKHLLQKYGEVDTILNYRNELNGTHIYNHPKFLEVFNRFKFIICVENSNIDGYISEKIFNCFHAKTIPIYNGCDITPYYFNKDCYINAFKIEQYVELIISLRDDEEKYNEFVNRPKISSTYTNQNVPDLLTKKLQEIKEESND